MTPPRERKKCDALIVKMDEKTTYAALLRKVSEKGPGVEGVTRDYGEYHKHSKK